MALLLLAIGAVFEIVALVRTLEDGKPIALLFIGLAVIALGGYLGWLGRSRRPDNLR